MRVYLIRNIEGKYLYTERDGHSFTKDIKIARMFYSPKEAHIFREIIKEETEVVAFELNEIGVVNEDGEDIVDIGKRILDDHIDAFKKLAK